MTYFYFQQTLGEKKVFHVMCLLWNLYVFATGIFSVYYWDCVCLQKKLYVKKGEVLLYRVSQKKLPTFKME